MMCTKSKQRYLCIDKEAYKNNNQFIARDSSRNMVIDLSYCVREKKHTVTCGLCEEAGPEKVLKARCIAEGTRYVSGNLYDIREDV